MHPPPRKPATPAEPSLMANIGAFFGEIAKAIKTDPSAPRTVELSRTEQSQPVETALGPAIATTRTVDEVAVTPAQNGQPAHVAARRITTEEITLPVNPPSISPKR
ncbi:MAG TPA: hypothetical protein VFF65_00305 [Phycisphaerales bacterium]|nr:hypothetical protein [Phycisphaerales bacterium]